MKFVRTIRDSIYGSVPVTAPEEEILKLPILNRLKGIKQLGLTYLEYPGANHTRYEHSIGVMHVSYLIGQTIGLDDADLQMVRFASLLHDLGHPPFSHTIEFAYCMFQDVFGEERITHEDVTFKIIESDENLKKIISKYRSSLHLGDIAKLAIGEYKKDKKMNSIISGPIDADKIDYILRDNYHCGFPCSLDINTISEVFTLHKDDSLILLGESGRIFAEQLLMGRYHLSSNIHHAPKNRLANYLMALTLKDAIESDSGKGKEKLKKLFDESSDAEMLTFLKENSKVYYPKLREFMLGTDNFKEIYNFDFSLHNPTGRYNNEILANEISFLPKVSEMISEKLKGDKEVFMDSYISKLPGLDMKISQGEILLNIGELPLIHGVVCASITNTRIAVYSFDNLQHTDIDWEEAVKLSSKLDKKLTLETAERRLRDFRGDKVLYSILMLSSYYVNEITKDIRKKTSIKSDQILLCLKAFDDVFEKELDRRRIYFDGLASFARLLAIIKSSEGILKDANGQIIETYDLEMDVNPPHFNLKQMPDDLLIDIEKMEMFGMLYRLTRVKKFGKKFGEMFVLRSSAWAHRYYNENLEFCQEDHAVFSRIKEKIQKLFDDNKNNYKELSKLSERRFDEDKKTQIDEIKAHLMVRITS
jgi:HD superfamily phosphohydrolase